jgi:hypothetical protein
MEGHIRGPVHTTSLRGRVDECALLDGLVADIRRGEGQSLILRGEAGIGKTALLEYLLASASDLTVVRAVGVESEMEFAFAGLQQLCAPLHDRLEGLPAPQRDALRVVFGLDAGSTPDRFLVGRQSRQHRRHARCLNSREVRAATQRSPARIGSAAGQSGHAHHRGRAAAAPLLEEATRIFADEEFVPEARLRWGWLTVVPSYVLWDLESNRAICVRQLEAVRDAGALARLPLEPATFTLVAVRCGDFADAATAIAEAEALSDASGARLSPFSTMMLAVLRGRPEAEALIELARREASDRGQGVAIHVAQWMSAVLSNSFGRYAEAVAAAQHAATDRPQELFGAPVWATLELIEAATRSGNPDMARIALERIVAATSFAATDSALEPSLVPAAGKQGQGR